MPLSHPSPGEGQDDSCTSPTCLHLPCCAGRLGSSNPSCLPVPRITGHGPGSSDTPFLPRNTGYSPGFSDLPSLPRNTGHGPGFSDPLLSQGTRVMVLAPQILFSPKGHTPLSLSQSPLSMAGPPALPAAPEVAEPPGHPVWPGWGRGAGHGRGPHEAH